MGRLVCGASTDIRLLVDTYWAAKSDWRDLGLLTIDELRLLAVEKLRTLSIVRRRTSGWTVAKTYMELLRRLAQGGVVLLDEVPADLILGQVLVAGIGGVLYS